MDKLPKLTILGIIILLLLIVAGSGYLFLNYDDISSAVQNKITGLASSITPDATQESSKIEISADVELTNLQLNTNSPKIILELSTPGQILVNTEIIDFSELTKADVEIVNFDGEISISDTISLSGSASKLVVNGISVLPEIKSLNLEISENFESAQISDVFLKSFSYTSSGTLEINNGQINVNLEDENFELKNFAGNFEVRDTMKMSGTTDKILVNGQNLEVNVE